ncbi:MAG: hypothetical protein HYY24_05780 [Verrucomicrobia bacterium]|nr:hypothetical protein [Verrucomicrobiota bacterium]
MLDAEFKLRQRVQLVSKRFDRVDLWLAAVTNLQGAGPPDLIFTCTQVEFVTPPSEGNFSDPASRRDYHDVSILVRSADLAPVIEYRLAEESREQGAGKLHVADFTGDGRPDLVVLRSEALVLEFVPPAGPLAKLGRIFGTNETPSQSRLGRGQALAPPVRSMSAGPFGTRVRKRLANLAPARG